MGDLPNNPLQPGKKAKKELSMEIRLLIAFLLMGLVLFLSPYLYKTPPPGPKQVSPTTPAQAAQETKKPEDSSPEAAKPQVADASKPVPGQIQAASEQQFTVDTEIYRVRFSNHGAVVQSWMLKPASRKSRHRSPFR